MYMYMYGVRYSCVGQSGVSGNSLNVIIVI